MQPLKFKAQLTNAFFATFNQMFGGSSQLPTPAYYRMLGSSRKLARAAETIHLNDGSEKHVQSVESACY